MESKRGRARLIGSPGAPNRIEWILRAIGMPQLPEPERLARLGRAVEEISGATAIAGIVAMNFEDEHSLDREFLK